MSLRSYSARIFAVFVLLLVAVLGASAVLSEVALRNFHQARVAAELATATELASTPALDCFAKRKDAAWLQQRIEDLARLTHVRLTVIDAGGTVVADSEAAPPLANHLDRPEVRAAKGATPGTSVRKSATTGKEMFYYARALGDGDAQRGYVRAAAELASMAGPISAFRAQILSIELVVLVAGLVVAWLAARSLAAPLVELEHAAADLARGVSPDGPDGPDGLPSAGAREIQGLAASLRSLAQSLRERQDSALGAHGQINSILAAMAEGVVAVDAEERVILMNQAGANLLGLERPLASGTALWARLRFPELESALRGALAGRKHEPIDAPSPRRDGRMLSLSIAAVRASADEGEPAFRGAVALLSDVTAIRRLEQVRIDFVANVSHELRTPLAAVLGALETLSDPDTAAATRTRFLEIASRNTARLQAIVSDLLDLSAIEALGDALPLEPTRVESPLRAAASALAGAAQSKGVKLEIELVPPGEHLVSGNHQRLEQVFTNLLENALKYTQNGGHVVGRVRPLARAIAIEVEDDGLGIPAAHLPRIFERFYRVDRSRSREMGGTGLGLAIVKHVVRAHGGTVEVESVEGRGSLFRVLLPRLSVEALRLHT